MLKLLFAKRVSDGKLVRVTEVERGLNCGCICLDCGQPLKANQGIVKQWYFSHSKNSTCSGESALHYYVKEIIENAPKFIIPSVELKDGQNDDEKMPFGNRCLTNCLEIIVDSVEVEKKIVCSDGSVIIPDLYIKSKDKFFAIEIYVTHKVDSNKRNKYCQEGISVLEIDLSKYRGDIFDVKLKDIVLCNSIHKYWIFNMYAKKVLFCDIAKDHEVNLKRIECRKALLRAREISLKEEIACDDLRLRLISEGYAVDYAWYGSRFGGVCKDNTTMGYYLGNNGSYLLDSNPEDIDYLASWICKNYNGLFMYFDDVVEFLQWWFKKWNSDDLIKQCIKSMIRAAYEKEHNGRL